MIDILTTSPSPARRSLLFLNSFARYLQKRVIQISAIHKEKFRSAKCAATTSKIVQLRKALIKPSLDLEKSPRVKASDFVLFHHTEVQKAISFLRQLLKTRVNSKYHHLKGSIYILHLLAFVEIRLSNVFFWETKPGFGIVMKKVRDAGISRKWSGNAESRPPPPPPPSFQTLNKELTTQAKQNKAT